MVAQDLIAHTMVLAYWFAGLALENLTEGAAALVLLFCSTALIKARWLSQVRR